MAGGVQPIRAGRRLDMRNKNWPNKNRMQPALSRRALLLGASALVAGCSSHPQTDAPAGGFFSLIDNSAESAATGSLSSPLKIALLLPLSAPADAGRIASDLMGASQLALIEVNKPGVSMVTKDTAGTADGASAAARAALAEGAELIIGPLLAVEVAATKVVAAPANVPVLAFSSDRSVAGNGAFLLSFLAGAEVSRIVSYAAAQGSRRFAALVPATPYGALVDQAFRAAVAFAGGQLAGIERFQPDPLGMNAASMRIASRLSGRKVAGAAPDALLIAGGADVLPAFGTLLPQAGINPAALRMLGTGAWEYPDVSLIPAFIGGRFAAPDPSGFNAFADRFSKTYGTRPVRIAGLAFDAITMAVALADGPAGTRFSLANLTRASGFAGVDGLFRLKSDGTSERSLAVLEVALAGPRLAEAAPVAFEAVAF